MRISRAVTDAVADGLHATTSAIGATWTPPDRRPSRGDLMDARREIENALRPINPIYIGRHVDRLSQVLAPRNASGLNWETITREFVAHLGDFPADIWRAAADEWVRTGTFFPTVAELTAIMAPMRRRRQTQLARVAAMLAATGQVEARLPTAAERAAHLERIRRENGLAPGQSIAALIGRIDGEAGN